VCRAAGIPLAGGHSIDSPEPIYASPTVGLIEPAAIKRNEAARGRRRAGAPASRSASAC